MKFCGYCGKEYTRHISYSKHILVCEILQDISKREEKCQNEETTNIPSQIELYKIIQELAFKQVKLEEQIKKLQTKKQKIKVVDWLNKNRTPSISFNDWIKEITIDNSIIEMIFNDNIVQTINTILMNKIKSTSENKSPVYGFIQKSNLLYIYVPETDDSKCWKKITPDEFVDLLKCIDRKLLLAMFAWQKENSKKLSKDDKLDTMFSKAMIKISSTSYDINSIQVSKIRTNLYNNIKYDLTNVEMEYEF